MSRHPQHETVVGALWRVDAPAGAKVYAIVDGARDEAIHTFVQGSGWPWRCLYTGELPPEMLETAPFLVQLERESAFTEELIARGWDEHWGIFMESVADLETLRRHFKRLLIVRDEEGTELLFRFYDPRVLRVYLPTCTDDESAAMFGPVARFVVRDEAPVVFSCAPGLSPAHLSSSVVIRGVQIHAFERSMLATFEGSLAEALPSDFPDECARFTPTQLREIVRIGVARALGHGISTDAGITIYVHLHLVLGADFDVRLPFASAILSSTSHEADRVDELYRAAVCHLHGGVSVQED